MSKYESKNWIATWETNSLQKKLPAEKKLKIFLDEITDQAVFQLEKGKKKDKKHYQIAFILCGPRKSKKAVLDIFKTMFDNISGLSVRIAHSRKAVFEYCSKEETRIGETIYAGRKENFNKEVASMELRKWQQDLYDLLLITMNIKEFKDRKIIWVGDPCGNTGKSAFAKWLVFGQKRMVAHKLPVSSVDRLNSAITKITLKDQTDIFVINLTRSKGKEQSYADLFSAIEDIKDGHVVDVMYGNYVEVCFKSPHIVVFSNFSLSDFHQYLSKDRWLETSIVGGEILHPVEVSPCNQEYISLSEVIKKYQAKFGGST